ncbi:MAG: hypothetical protein FIB01_12505 [Gemmatimonadetes bacterium]|nr:hypothetical protein [Gemmatimonadota bacterium]
MRARITAHLLAPLLLLAACDSGGPKATLQISGDTLVHAATFGLPDGQQNANCGYRLLAHVDGDPGDTAIIRQGKVTYSFLDNGALHGSWEWTPDRLGTLWEQPRIPGGETETSKHHEISFSLPFRPVRGEVVFDYTVAGDDAVHTTSPFVFSCR